MPLHFNVVRLWSFVPKRDFSSFPRDFLVHWSKMRVSRRNRDVLILHEAFVLHLQAYSRRDGLR